MTARLFVIEGTAASGKSATAKFVADCLRLKGRRVVCIDEGSNANPADYEAHAFLNDAALTHFTDFEKQQIFAVGYRESGGIAAPLTEFSGDLLKKLMHFKIYDFLPWETEKPVILDKWRKFAATAKTDATYVLNAVLLQNPFCETMMRFGFPLETTREYVREICVAAAPLSPAVIYLHNANIGQSVKNVVRERGKKWLNAVVSYHENGAYGKSVGAKGFDGYIACLTERQKRELEILPTLPVASTVIENANADWQTAHAQIAGFVNRIG